MDHIKEDLENVFTSTATKLLKHLDRLQEVQQNGKFRPITLQIAPTDKCNLKCEFCSVKYRSGDEIPLNKIIKSIDDFQSLGILSCEVTGGGDPTCYPNINELIEYIKKQGLDVGLITNGIALKKIKQENLNQLTWLRISLNWLDKSSWSGSRIPPTSIEIPKIKGTLGFSYVWNEESTIEKLQFINEFAETHNAEYVRIVPNCLNVQEQEKYKANILPIMNQFPNFFFQIKSYQVYSKCMIGWLKPYLNADGYLYHCSANPLIEQKFNPKFRICHMSDIKTAWRKQKAANTNYCEIGKCFYAEQNMLIDSLIKTVPHKNFI